MLIPPDPAFATDSERRVWTALARSLEPGEVLFHGLRFTDPKEGDVEIDLLLLSPSRGAAVIEVKGGLVKYQQGQWTLTSQGGAERRIHPVEQARRAKHALRRYLDRSPDWDFGLLRSQWFLAFPRTPLNGDLGPEAPRERIIAQGDIENIRDIIDNGLRDAPREPGVPDSEWVPLAVRLIQSAPEASHSAERLARAHSQAGHGFTGALALIGLAVAVLLGSFAAVAFLGPWGAAIAAVLVGVAVAVGYRATRHRSRIPLWLSLTVVVGSVIVGGMLGRGLQEAQLSAEEPIALTPFARDSAESAGIDAGSLPCNPAYSPCVRQMPWDRDCADIGFRVTLVGKEDPYGLDRDGDGLGCASFPESSAGEENR